MKVTEWLAQSSCSHDSDDASIELLRKADPDTGELSFWVVLNHVTSCFTRSIASQTLCLKSELVHGIT